MDALLLDIDHGSKLATVITLSHPRLRLSQLFLSFILAYMPCIRIYSTTTTGYISDLIPLILRLLLFIFYSFADLVTLAGGGEGVSSGVSILGRLSALDERNKRLGLWGWARIGILRRPGILERINTGLFGLTMTLVTSQGQGVLENGHSWALLSTYPDASLGTVFSGHIMFSWTNHIVTHTYMFY